MTRLLVIILLFGSHLCMAQNTQKITDRFSPEIYYALESDKNVRHGKYQLNVGEGKDLVIGQYDNNKCVGLWEAFDPRNNRIVQAYDFNNKQFTLYTPDTLTNNRFFFSTTNGDTGTLHISRNPIYLGHYNTIGVYIDSYLEYYLYRSTIGTSIIKFTVYKDGTIGNYRAINKLGIESVIFDALKDLPLLWVPGEKNGELIDVDVEYHLKITLRNESQNRMRAKKYESDLKAEEKEFKILIEQSKRNSEMRK